MADPRVADAVRKTPVLLEKLQQDVIDLKADNMYIKDMLRAIKKSVVKSRDVEPKDPSDGKG